MKYAILEATFPEQLAKQVMELLKKGWSLAGGVSVVAGTGCNAGTLTYFQAMTGPGEIERC